MENLKQFPKKRGRKPLKKPVEVDPTAKALAASGLTVAQEDTPHEHPAKTQTEEERRKKYRIASKWPCFKFYKAVVSRADATLKEYPMAKEEMPDTQYFNRGVGSPVYLFLNREVIIPEEIVNAIKDTGVQFPVVLGNDITEKSNGFNHFENRARFRVSIVSEATPEEYEANVMIGKAREL